MKKKLKCCILFPRYSLSKELTAVMPVSDRSLNYPKTLPAPSPDYLGDVNQTFVHMFGRQINSKRSPKTLHDPDRLSAPAPGNLETTFNPHDFWSISTIRNTMLSIEWTALWTTDSIQKMPSPNSWKIDQLMRDTVPQQNTR